MEVYKPFGDGLYIYSYRYIYIAAAPSIDTMPVITIYLNESMWEFVKHDKSRLIQQAIKELMDKLCPTEAPANIPPFPINDTAGKSG